MLEIPTPDSKYENVEYMSIWFGCLSDLSQIKVGSFFSVFSNGWARNLLFNAFSELRYFRHAYTKPENIQM